MFRKVSGLRRMEGVGNGKCWSEGEYGGEGKWEEGGQRRKGMERKTLGIGQNENSHLK